MFLCFDFGSVKEAEVCLAETETDLQELQSVSDTVAEYFCEDPSKFKMEECCSIFKSFCEKFMRAIQVRMYTSFPSLR